MTVNDTSTIASSNATVEDNNHITRIVEGCVLSVICSVALTGNISLWLVILKTRELRDESNYLILCLSSADILVSLSMPITCFTIFNHVWIFGDAVCQITGFVNMVTFIASVMSLGVISVNRYVKVCQNHRYKTIYSRRNMPFIIIGVWLLSSGLAVPPLVGWGTYDYLQSQSFCFCDWSTSVTYTFFMVGVCFGGPCSVMTISYFYILRKYRRSSRKIETIHNLANAGGRAYGNNCMDSPATSLHCLTVPQPELPPSNRITRKEKRRMEEIRITTSLLVVIFAFVLSWLPFCVTMFLAVFVENYSWRSLDMFTLILGYANSCYNPFIYGLLNTRVNQGYRKQFFKILSLCGVKPETSQDSESTPAVEIIPVAALTPLS